MDIDMARSDSKDAEKMDPPVLNKNEYIFALLQENSNLGYNYRIWPNAIRLVNQGNRCPCAPILYLYVCISMIQREISMKT